MSQRSWIILGFVSLVVLSFIAYWDEWKTKLDIIEKQSKNRIDFPNDHQILSLTFYHRDEQSQLNNKRFTKIVSKAKDWEISVPRKRFADARMINSLLQNLRRYQYEKVIDNASLHLNEYGINSSTPDLEVVYKEVSGQLVNWQVYLGDDAPVGYMLYFNLGSPKKVYVGSKHLALMLKKSPFDLREKRMLRPWLNNLLVLKIIKQSGEIMGLTWNGVAENFKNQSGIDVSSELVGKLKNELEKVSISEFLPSDQYSHLNEHFSAYQPWLNVEVRSQTLDKSEFKIYLSGNELVGFDTGKKEVFKLPLSSLRNIDKYFDEIKLN